MFENEKDRLLPDAAIAGISDAIEMAAMEKRIIAIRIGFAATALKKSRDTSIRNTE